jgi:hypothetical protein
MSVGKKIVRGSLLIAALGVFVSMLPDLKRYVKMERM